VSPQVNVSPFNNRGSDEAGTTDIDEKGASLHVAFSTPRLSQARCVSNVLAPLDRVVSGGCDRMITPRHAQQLKDADSQSRCGRFCARDQLVRTAEDRLAMPKCIKQARVTLRRQEMDDPLNALHHFKRYPIIAPSVRERTMCERFRET